MPNHVLNIIELIDKGGLSIEEISKTFINDKGFFDFNLLIPMPECLKGFNPHSGEINTACAVLKTPLDDHPLIKALEIDNRKESLDRYSSLNESERLNVERCVKNYHECGYVYWYDWALENWGTKWNAYSQPDEGFGASDTEWKFETAWCHPKELVLKISRTVPEAKFVVKFADESIGSNCGKYELSDGQCFNSWPDEAVSEKTLREFAFNLWYPDDNPRDHGYDENWQYVGEE